MRYEVRIFSSDVPLLLPSDVDYFPNVADIDKMTSWLKYCIAKELVQYHGAFKSCKKFIRPPEVRFSKKMGQKSKVTVLALDLEDPATTEGIIRVCKKLVPYVPSLPSREKQKTVVFGDQGLFEKGIIIIAIT